MGGGVRGKGVGWRRGREWGLETGTERRDGGHQSKYSTCLVLPWKYAPLATSGGR